VRWPNSTIYYFWNTADFNTSELTALQNGITNWNFSSPKVKWIWSTTAINRVQFLKTQPSDPLAGRCGYADIGMINGIQSIHILCFDANTPVHEMGHVTGLLHEQERCDRDRFVTTIGLPKRCDNSQDWMVGLYDYNSVMHYPIRATEVRKTATHSGLWEHLAQGMLLH
jgi:Astacin (Peptidase family M12A)